MFGPVELAAISLNDFHARERLVHGTEVFLQALVGSEI